MKEATSNRDYRAVLKRNIEIGRLIPGEVIIDIKGGSKIARPPEQFRGKRGPPNDD